MSGYLDDRATALTERLLQKFGKVAEYSKENEPVYDDDTGETTEAIPTSYMITCYIDAQRTGEMLSQGLISNTETVILVSAKELGIEPKAGDDIIFASSATYSVKRFNSIWSGEEVALYECIGLR